MTGIGHNGGPAYPCKTYTQSGHPNGESMGMSLRDYFAGQALVGILSDRSKMAAGTSYKAIVTEAYRIADDMLVAREETP